jgi:hypothetical protein
MNSIFGALKYIPATVARKALEKVNPGFKSYFSSALSYGVDADRALEYLTDRLESESQKATKREFAQGEANQTLRPDEQASKSQIANAEIPGRILRGAAAIGLGAGLGGLGGGKGAEEEPSRLQLEDQRTDIDKQKELDKQAFKEKVRENKGLYAEKNPGEVIQAGMDERSEIKPSPVQSPIQKAEANPRVQALQRHSEMTKRKKLIDDAMEAFDREYGADRQQGIKAPDWSQIMGGGAKNPPKSPNNIQRLMGILEQMQRGQ